MIIIHQSRQGMTNLDACKNIQLNEKGIEAYYIDGTKKLLAYYDLKKRAKEVFEDLIFYASNVTGAYELPED